MKKIILSLLIVGAFICGIAKKSEAANYITSISTGLLVSTATNVEVTGIWVSTGFNTPTSYLLLIDSYPLSGQGDGNNLRGQGSVGGAFTEAMYIAPPIIPIPSTASITGQYNFINFTDKDGRGLPIEKGLVVQQFGGNAAWYTIGIQRKR